MYFDTRLRDRPVKPVSRHANENIRTQTSGGVRSMLCATVIVLVGSRNFAILASDPVTQHPFVLYFTASLFLAMADSGDDIDDELLELAGASEKKRKKRQASSSKLSAKRRKAE